MSVIEWVFLIVKVIYFMTMTIEIYNLNSEVYELRKSLKKYDSIKDDEK